MGSGQFGGNGSVRWLVEHTAGGGGIGMDPTDHAQMRKDPNNPLVSSFRVTITTYAFNPAGHITGSNAQHIEVPVVNRRFPQNVLSLANPVEILIEW